MARAWTALDAQLQRRAGLAEELAREHAGALGAGAGRAALAAAAADARAPAAGDRELAENASAASCASCRPSCPASRRRCATDLDGHRRRGSGWPAGSTTTPSATPAALRRRRLPRLLRLHARRPLPRFFDIDDRPRRAPVAGSGERRRPDGPADRPYDGASATLRRHRRGSIP